jgi:Polysaccharide biosynthesis protein
MSAAAHVRLYRSVTRLYPRRFRDEYRDDLVDLFACQVADDGPGRSWGRAVRDLAVTVPSQHLEAHMERSAIVNVTSICIVVAGSATLLAAVVGVSFYALLLLMVAIGAIVVSVFAHRADKPAVVQEGVRSWKKILGIGVAILAVVIVVMNLPQAEDSAEWPWFAMMLGLLTGVTMTVAGLYGAIVNRGAR